MKLIPVDDRLLVEPRAAEAKTASGLVLPETAQDKPQMGTVLAVGSDEELQKLFQVGQTVVFTKYGGVQFKLDGKELLILSRSDVLAIAQE